MKAFNHKKIINGIIFGFSFIVPLLFVVFRIDNDTYWIIKTGEYICNNGIPAKDFLTMHTDMDLVIQQWLSDVIYYKLYSIFGLVGPMLLVYAVLVLFLFLVKKLTEVYTGRPFLAAFVTLVSNIIIAYDFFVTRPQIFTYCIVAAELRMLEKYVRTGKWKYLILLPFLSVLSVNLHASMWTMLYIMMLPYFANALPIKWRGKSLSCCKILPLVITAVAMFLCGFINPYGFKGLSFIFTTSVGNKVNSSISELQALEFSLSFTGIAYVALIALVVCAYLFFRGGKTQMRFVLLTVGTALMGMMHIKLFPYFLIAAYPATLVYLDSADIKGFVKKLLPQKAVQNENKPKENTPEDSKRIKLLLKVIGVMCVVLVVGLFADIAVKNFTGLVPEEYRDLEEVMMAVEKDAEKNGNEIVLYNEFNNGGYLEFLGYTTYIDARADSFVVEANHDFDYLTEYFDFYNGNIYYQDVIDKYGFNYLILEYHSKSDDTEDSSNNEDEESPMSPLYVALSNDSNYSCLYEGDYYTVFVPAS